ncbi:MAG: M20/M25/M40 family metallo-hydrolase [Gammaproteobacteria bacterium]|nr:M20/M25/M40 family metallo-hydrolase [Gammaproteobacteria bacterium]
MKLLKVAGFALIALILVMGVKTLTFTLPEVVIQPQLDASEVDAQAVAGRLSKGIQFATISHMDESQFEQQAFDGFHQFLANSFPLVHQKLSLERVNGYSLLYRWQGSDAQLKPILLMSHQDVVPVDKETRDRWVHAPFSGAIADGIIWGRGAVDIKSGVLGALEAVEDLLAKGYQPQRDVYLAFGHDEEIGGDNGAAKISALLKARGLDFQFILDEGGSIVGDGIIPGMERPVALVGIAEKGYVSLRLTAKAVGGHSSMPPKHTALGVIAQAIVDLEQHPFPANMQYSRQLFDTIGPAMGGLEKAIFANMWLTEPLVERILSGSKTTNAAVRTTTAVTMAQGSSKDNVLPSESHAVVNFRIMPGETGESVKAYVESVIDNPEIEVTIEGGFAGEPSSVSKSNNDSFAMLKDAIYRVTQDENLIVAPYLVTGGTDAKHYTGLSDSIYRFAFNRFTPETLERMHGINEQIKVDDYVDVVKFFRELILGANPS